MNRRIAKRENNYIHTKEFDENGKVISCGSTRICDIDLSQSLVAEVYCREFCRKCYHFGCDWDIRCSHNGDKPIQQVVSSCDKYLNAKKLAKELRDKLLTDKNFYEFCKVKNAHYSFNRKYDLERFLGIFNR